MNTRIIPEKINVLTVIIIVALFFTILFGAGLASAGLMKYATANLSNFLPIIMGKAAVEPVATDNVLIVFSSIATTDGDAGGRTGLANFCLSEDPASHLCSLNEIETAWENRGVIFRSPFQGAWVDNPFIGLEITNYILGTGIDTSAQWNRNSNENCLGWVTNTNPAPAIIIADNAVTVANSDCSLVNHVTCCKSAP